MAPLVLGPGGGFAFGGGGGNGPAPPSRPAAFTVGMWGLADAETGGTLTVTIDSLPDDRGFEIIDIEYSIDGGGWESSGGVVGFDISSLTDDREYAVRLRAINANGAGPASDIKRATPTGEVVPAPSWSSPPTVSGTARVGETLTATGGTIINGTADGWVWLRDDDPIPGATSATYVLTIDDVGAMVGPRELAAGPGGSAYADAVPVGPVEDVAPADRLVVNYNADDEQYEITNAAEFPGATWAWQDETGAPIVGQTGTTLARADAPPGLAVRAIANDDPSTASNLALAPLVMIELDETFDAPDGTNLDGYNGWVLRNTSGQHTPAQADLVKIRPGGVYVEGNTGTRFFCRPLDSAGPKKITIFGWRNTDAPNSLLESWRSIYLYYDPANRTNYVQDLINNGTQLSKTVGGTGTNFTNQTSTINNSTPSAGLSVSNGRGRTFIAGNETAASVSGNGWDVSDVPQFAGIALDLYGGQYPSEDTGSYRVLSRILIENVLEETFNLTVYSSTEPDVDNPVTEHSFIGTCTDSITEFDWCIVGPDGKVLTPWVENVPVDSAGNWSIATTLPEDVEGISNAGLAMRPSDDVSALTINTIAQIDAYYPFETTIWGHQSSNVAGWSDEDIFTDRTMQGTWVARVGGSWVGIPPKVNGTPDIDAVAGAEYYVIKLWESGTVGYERGGQYTVSWTMDNVTAQWEGGISNATPGAIDNVNKTATISIADMDRVNAHLRFTKTGGATGDFIVQAVRDGETATGPINDKALASFIPGTIQRYMKQQGIEYPYPEIGEPPIVTYPNGRSLPELIGDATAQTGTIPWVCFPTNDSDDFVLDFATRLKATIPAGVTIYVEWGNELQWNTAYVQSTTIQNLKALGAGLVSGAPTEDWINGMFPVAYGREASNDIPYSVLYEPILAGQRVLLTGGRYQWTAIEAKVDLDPGEQIPDIRPDTFRETEKYIIYANYGPISTGANIYAIQRTSEIKAIFEAVFAGRNPIKSVYGIQIGAQNSRLVQLLTAQPEHGKNIDIVSPSHYATANINWESSPPAWLLDPDNATAWQAGMTAWANEKIAPTIATLQAHKGLYAALRELGWAAHEVPRIGTYEGELHCSLTNIPEAYGLATAARMREWKASQAAYDWAMDYSQALDALGLHCIVDFAQHQTTRMGNASNGKVIIDNFGFLRAVNSQNSPTGSQDQKWLARQAFLAARDA